jgi:hypothetical protein
MGLLVPAGVGLLVLPGLWRRGLRRGLGEALLFAALATVAAAPCYVRNAVETGNPIYPFGYSVFGGRHWSAEAAAYLDAYYREYRTVHGARAGHIGADESVLRFPWDMTMYPYAFEKGARTVYDISPFLLAMLPGLLLVQRRRRAAWGLAGFAAAYFTAVAMSWTHPRYVYPALPVLYAAGAWAAEEGARVRLWRGLLLLAALTVSSNLLLAARYQAPTSWTSFGSPPAA